MAYNFSANQFEGSFKPKKLGNWEVAKWFPERPRAHRTSTKIIADDRGHLLPGVQRAPSSPWGDFCGTWQLPKKISRKTAEELNKPFTRARQSWLKRSSHVPIISPEPSPECPEDKDNGKFPSVVNDNPGNYNNKEDDKDSGVDVSNEPSSPVRELEEKSRRSCYDKYIEDDYSKATACDKTPANINTSSKVRKDVEEFIRTCKTPKELGEKVEELEEMPQENVQEMKKKRGPPLAQSYCSSQIAKNLAVENLKHHPLPDTVEDAIYRSLQMKKERHPGKALDVLPRAAAVGCKSYGTPGPTQCSKLKVYRPKTAGVLPRKDLGQSLELLTRPKTSSGFDQQTRKDKKLSQMQLALCWDLKPVNPGDEPKRSPHIDGSNGSAAPAVFALVQPPQEELPPPSPTQEAHPTGDGRKSKKCLSKPRDAWGTSSPPAIERDIHRGRYGVTNPSAVMDIINTNTTQSGNMVGPKDTINLHEHRNGSGHRHYDNRGHTECNSVDKNSINSRKGSGTEKDSHNSSSSSGFDSVKLARRKHCHSSPNLTNVGVNDVENNVDNDLNNNDNGCGRNGRGKLLNNRPCMACDTSCSANCHKSSKPEYKMAFKAGKPDNNGNKQQNGSIKNNGSNASGHSLSSLRSNGYQAPKPKVPYAKRSYSIGTLAPPFSLWPGTTGQDYPEHWRLASVYQHSYKPMGSRRKTFLQSVYQ